MYVFKQDVSKLVEIAIYSHDPEPTIGDLDIDKKSVYIEVGSGNNGISFTINQTTGKIEVQLSNPNSNKNEWAGEFAEDLKETLQSLVVPVNGGRRSKKTRKTRKLKRRL